MICLINNDKLSRHVSADKAKTSDKWLELQKGAKKET